ncbi:hypothetical protein HELRODRAFT_171080 [Helobdella robusta]|uniref:Major facilitator superfamily (MFS) profile domain-containing protein n=1 Tax=Helobdella robusta TaxID=6412 RepID=T1F3S9_HELRO|nr:hypothetical protein HELRODRAFT_171080 [Helobdella robusta]ESO07037.1 hypothetical protein HELRODRAFT_171080 [Helobdella robusta]
MPFVSELKDNKKAAINTGATAVSMLPCIVPTIFIRRLGRNSHRVCGILGTILEGAATLIFNPQMNYLIEHLSWRAVFKIQGTLILFIGVLGSWTFVSDQQQQQQQQQTANKSDLRSILKSLVRCNVFCWFFGQFFNSIFYYAPFNILPHYMTTKNLTTSNISLVMTMLSLSECLLYIVTSLPGDYLAGKLIYVNICACLLVSILNLCWPFLDSSVEWIVGLAIADGMLLATSYAYLFACSSEATGLDIDLSWSVSNTSSGFATLFAPLFSSLIYDTTKSYFGVFMMTSLVAFLSALFYFFIPLISNNNNNDNNCNNDQNNIATT